MSKPTNIQVINGPDGRPAFVVIPYDDYVRGQNEREEGALPHEVVGLIVIND